MTTISQDPHVVRTEVHDGVDSGAAPAVRMSVRRPAPARAAEIAARLGLDAEDLERRTAAQHAQLRRAADEQLHAAVADSAAGASRLRAVLDTLAAGNVVLSGADAAPSGGYSSVDVPTRIFTTGGLALDATDLVSFNSSARVQRPSSNSIDHQEVVFVFPYSNGSGVDQVVQVSAVVGLNGVVEATDDGGWTVFGHDHNTLLVTAFLRVFGDSDADGQVGLQVDANQLLSIDAYEDSWPQSVGAIVSQTLVRGTALGAQDLLVKAGDSRVFHLGIAFDSSPPGGSTQFDFSTGEQKVSGFGMFVHVTS